MHLYKELEPCDNARRQKKLKKLYEFILEGFRLDGFELTQSEAVFLRQTIRECFDEDTETRIKMKLSGNTESGDIFSIYCESIARFFWNYYGINISEYLLTIKAEDNEQAVKDLFKYIQQKVRTAMELI